MKNNVVRILLIGIFLLPGLLAIDYRLLTNYAYASDDLASLPVEVNGDEVQYFESEKKVTGKGNVVVTYKDVRMTCNKVTAFLESKEATAEGDVVVTRGESQLRGQKIVYNFETETGTIMDGSVKSGVWYAGGKELKKVSANEVDIADGYVTTCDLAKPHYSIRSKRVKVYFGNKVVAKNVTFNVGNVPILYIPIYSQPVKEKFPKVTLVPGYDKKWGGYLLSSYRYNITDNSRGNLHLDYRYNKGLGEGVDYNFNSANIGSGYFRGYYTHERDRKTHYKDDRWRTEYRHKWGVLPDTTVAAEYHNISDKTFIKDYFYREEYEIDPQPQSYVSVIQTKPNYAVNLFAKKRINDFFTEVERLPEAALNFKNQRLLENLPFFYKGDFDFVSLDKKVADSSQQNNVVRFDTYNQIALPFRVANFLSVDPYAGTQQTYYTREIDERESRFRGALYTGVDLSSNFFRLYDHKTDFLNMDIDGVRHIFTPNISYYYVSKPTLSKNNLFEFDDVDTLESKNGIGFTLENKLQTKRFDEKKNERVTAELVRWILGTDYLLHMNNGNKLSDVNSDMEIHPYPWLFLKQTGIYDPKSDNLETLNTDIVADDPAKNWRFGLGHRFEHSVSSQVTGQWEAKLTPKWKYKIFELYEFKNNDMKEQEYSITRDLHCWEAEFTYSVRDVHTFWIIFHLKAFPEIPLKLGTSYYRPRSGSDNN